MRSAIVGVLGFLLVGCAHGPEPAPQIAEVPMYTPAEWADMNSVSSVPEIADNTVLKIDSLGSSHFSMHVHTHHFHMHVH